MIAVLKQRLSKHKRRLSLKIANRTASKPVLDQYDFGYGTNLDSSQFTRLGMNAEEVGVAILAKTEYKNKGYAGVDEKEGCLYWG